MKYNHQAIEAKWQREWSKQKNFHVSEAPKGRHEFVLDMFPYPSGDGLHVGHPEGYTATDIFSRYLRMNGVKVLHPMGWDAFGLPAENAAIKKGIHPSVVTKLNIANFKRQIQSIGFSYDWDREVNTTDPNYYKWTQWIFLQLFKKGLAYEKEAPIWWCPKDKTGLANEEVVDGKCDRCGTPVEKKMLKQWMLKITKYAERLLDGLEKLDWPEGIKALQRNWIGRSEGAEVGFRISSGQHAVLLHGFTGSPKANFFPWLKDQLEQENISVEVPTLPNTENPTVMHQVEYVEKNCKITEDTVIVGHSLGVPVALKVIERLKHPVAKLVMAGGFITPDFTDHERPFASSFDWQFDWEKINKNVSRVVVLHDTNDDAVSKKQAEALAEAFGTKPEFVQSNDVHFCALEEPTILDNILFTVKVFTTRPDTLFGATYMVLSPEHPLVDAITTPEQKKKVEKYQKEVAAKSDLERTALEKEKTGVFTGAFAINPVNNEKIPVWIADYVLMSYGTGAIMAVPAHDQRDYKFAKKFNLPIREVVAFDHIAKGTNATRLDAETDERTVIDAIIEGLDGKFLLIEENTNNILNTHLVGGGTDGEDDLTAVRREVLEETGYKDIEIVGKVPGSMFSQGFRHTKGRNQKVFGSVYHVKLKSNQRVESEVEEGKHKLVWAPREKIFSLITWGHHRQMWDAFVNDQVYAGEGKMINGPFRQTSPAQNLTEAPSISAGAFGHLSNELEIVGYDGPYDELSSEEFRKLIVAWLAKVGKGKPKVQYKLRDWVFSRQRYWGEPIPLVHCPTDGVVPVDEKDLPVLLPEVEKYEPTGTGESPLAGIEEWVNTTCPKCDGPAKRETNTMPQWAGSCWYYLRFTDPHNDKEFASKKAMKAWLPVDLYVGGAEHAVLHLLYARFWHKVLYDMGHIPKEVGDEPFQKLKNQGLILGPDGEKMSKSRGNVINPDEIIEQHGADTLRMYEMFMGPFEDAKPWDTNGIIGVRRFLEKVWRASERVEDSKAPDRHHKYAQRITEGIENFRFNTCVSDLMKWINEIGTEKVSKDEFGVFLKLLSPFAPHISEELWSMLGNKTLLAQEKWPKFDPKKVKEETVTIAVQVMGKLRGTLTMGSGATQSEVEKAAKSEPNVRKYLTSEPKKIIFVKDKLVNFVL